MPTVATWNVNSIRARLPNVLEWLRETAPDIVLLQETKCENASFPALEIEELGYNLALCGQKTHNGVAILAKAPIEDVRRGLPGDEDDVQARYIEALVGDVRVASIYLPNGNPADSPKYPYKLAWMARLRDHARALLEQEEPLVLGGDYNVIPEPRDCHDPAAWEGDALFRLDTRRAFRAIVNQGLTDAFRVVDDEGGRYTFWDYQGGAWPLDHGIRIDHLLLSPAATDRLAGCRIDKTPRGKQKASDHTPVVAELD